MCTIGYFEHNGKKYAGKNREPGKNSLDTLVIRTRHITRPKLFYLGIDPENTVNLANEILRVAEDKRYFDLADDLAIKLYKLAPKEKLPTELKKTLSENIWGGIYLNKNIGMPAASPTKAIFVIPFDGPTTIGNYSHYNLERSWGGVNEGGVFMQSSSIRHENRLIDRPSYSVITNDILLNCENVNQAVKYLEKTIKSGKNKSPGGANFLIADDKRQVIIEYLPADVLGSEKYNLIFSEGESKDFRSNFGLESKFFERKGWNLQNSKFDEKEHFIRSINRFLVSHKESGPNIFSSHTVYQDLFDDEILNEIVNMMNKGELMEVGLSSPTQFASFYSICTHPVTKKDNFSTYKRTFWNMVANLTDNKVLLSYDNCCQSGAEIEIDPKKINQALKQAKFDKV
ncbi:hypothetical protein KAR52_00305 [Candidatus Pacearchaeota archaeon]|nr:hypothetical protein [Candidatus Pacearchaeota archaeon]